MIIRGQRVSRARLTGDPFLGIVGKALGSLGRKGFGFVKGAVKSQLGIPQSADRFTKQMAQPARVGTPERPAVIQIGGTRVPFPDDPLGIGRRLGFAPGAGAGGRRGRRMRVTNVRALRRALRRVEGFGRLARRYVRIKSRFKAPKRRRR